MLRIFGIPSKKISLKNFEKEDSAVKNYIRKNLVELAEIYKTMKNYNTKSIIGFR